MSSKDEKKEKSSSSKDKSSSSKDKKEKSSRHHDKDKESSHKDREHREHRDKDKEKDRSEKKSSSSSSSEKIKELETKLADRDELVKKLQAQVAELEKKQGGAKTSSVEAASEETEVDNGEITYESKTGKSIVLNAEWKGRSAGGSMDNITWRYNPQIFIKLSRTSEVTISLIQPETEGTFAGIGWYLLESPYDENKRVLSDGDELTVAKAKFARAQEVSGTFTLKKGMKPYVLIPATLDPNEESTFKVKIVSDAPLTAQLISKEQEWTNSILGEWSGDTAGGCPNFDSFVRNPQYLLNVSQQTKVSILLLQDKLEEFDPISFYVIKTEKDRKQKITERSEAKGENAIIQASFSNAQDSGIKTANFPPGSYAIIPCTFNPGHQAQFELYIMPEREVGPLVELKDAAVVSLNGEWKGENAGGCLNDVRKWRLNKQYQLLIKKDLELTIKLRQTNASDDPASLGFYIFNSPKRVVRPTKKSMVHKTKFVGRRDGLLEKVKLSQSDQPYIIVPCTYDPDVEAQYSIQIFSSDSTFTQFVELTELSSERELERSAANGEWKDHTAGGCLNYATWRNNPQFSLEVLKETEVNIFLTCDTDYDGMTPGFYIVDAPQNMNLCVDLNPEKVKWKAPFRETLEVGKTEVIPPGKYNIIPCTYKQGQECPFEVAVYAESGSVRLNAIRTGLLHAKGEWKEGNAGGCINSMVDWLNNPRFYVAVKQHTELACVIIQHPGSTNINLTDLKEIGFYVTNSDGDGNPKTNESGDLLAQAEFTPDRDAVAIFSLPACHWPYVLTPCTFNKDIFAPFEIYLLMDYENLEFVELSSKNIDIKPDEVVGAGESAQLREVKRRFKTLGPAVIDLVKITENIDKGIPEFMKWAGRQLLQNTSQFQDGISSWVNDEEPSFWTDYYEEEDPGEVEPASVPDAPPAPPAGGPPPPPPPKKGPPVNFSKPPKLGMVETGKQANISEDQLAALEQKKEARNYVDEMLNEIKGGLVKLKKAAPLPPKPKVEDPLLCAFDMTIITQRRAILEGLNDKDDDDWDNDWEDEKE